MSCRLEGIGIEPRRVFCIGLNYRAHVEEMGSSMPEEPVVFMKPGESLLIEETTITLPSGSGSVHYEAELVVVLGEGVGPGAGWDGVAGAGLGLDLTLRDVQRRLKSAGLPWERAKAFEGSAPVGAFVPVQELENPDALEFELLVGERSRQRGDTRDLVFGVPALIDRLSRVWRLRPGDLIFTGTPAGVGPLEAGDRVTLRGPELGTSSWTVR